MRRIPRRELEAAVDALARAVYRLTGGEGFGRDATPETAETDARHLAADALERLGHRVKIDPLTSMPDPFTTGLGGP